MEINKPPVSDAKEALIVEMLGNLGKLHNQIDVLPGELKSAIQEAYGEALSKIADQAENKKRELIRFNARRQSGISWWKALFIGLVAAVGAVAGSYLYSYYVETTRADYAELGLAAARVWGELPEDVKGQIQAARTR